MLLSWKNLNGQFNAEDWYLDSGASAHLTVKNDWLVNISEQSTMEEIIMANKTKISVICNGDLIIMIIEDKQKHDAELTTNLLSESKLIEKEIK